MVCSIAVYEEANRRLLEGYEISVGGPTGRLPLHPVAFSFDMDAETMMTLPNRNASITMINEDFAICTSNLARIEPGYQVQCTVCQDKICHVICVGCINHIVRIGRLADALQFGRVQIDCHRLVSIPPLPCTHVV